MAGLDYFGGYDRISKGFEPDAFTRAVDRSYFPEANQEVRDIASWTVPTSPAELGAMLMFGPGGKLVRLGGLGAMTGGYSPDTEAGILSKLAGIFPEVAKTRKQPINLVRQEGVIKPKGGNWLTNPDGPLARLYDRQTNFGGLDGQYRIHADALQALEESMAAHPDQIPTLREAYEATQQSMRPLQERKAVADWIRGPLNKYVKNQMATPEDPLRALAEEGKWFKDADPQEYSDELENLAKKRTAWGFPAEGLAVGPEAKAWENFADDVITPYDVASVPGYLRDENPWLGWQNPTDTVYGTTAGYVFDDLIKKLNYGLTGRTPASGLQLPEHLRLSPEKIKQMGMEKAVRWADEVEQYEAAHELAKVRSLADKLPVLKAYPEGYKWVEIAPPKGMPLNESEDLVEQLLKYEGDTMKHCVGGYCDDVLNGHSRIFSLRDPQGYPRITAEAAYDPETGEFGIMQVKGKANSVPEKYMDYARDFFKSKLVPDAGIGANDYAKADYAALGFVDPEPLRRINRLTGQQYLTKTGDMAAWPEHNFDLDMHYTKDELQQILEKLKPDDVDEDFWGGFYKSITNPRYISDHWGQ